MNKISLKSVFCSYIRRRLKTLAMRLLLAESENERDKAVLLELFKIEQYADMVLQYQRLESMTTDLIFKPCDLYDLAKQAVRKYAQFFIRKKLKLNMEEFSCVVLTDEKWAVFVIGQVISNAVKYTRKGEISIYLHSEKPKALVIEDTGIGIAKRGFAPNFRAWLYRLQRQA